MYTIPLTYHPHTSYPYATRKKHHTPPLTSYTTQLHPTVLLQLSSSSPSGTYQSSIPFSDHTDSYHHHNNNNHNPHSKRHKNHHPGRNQTTLETIIDYIFALPSLNLIVIEFRAGRKSPKGFTSSMTQDDFEAIHHFIRKSCKSYNLHEYIYERGKYLHSRLLTDTSGMVTSGVYKVHSYFSPSSLSFCLSFWLLLSFLTTYAGEARILRYGHQPRSRHPRRRDEGDTDISPPPHPRGGLPVWEEEAAVHDRDEGLAAGPPWRRHQHPHQVVRDWGADQDQQHPQRSWQEGLRRPLWQRLCRGVWPLLLLTILVQPLMILLGTQSACAAIKEWSSSVSRSQVGVGDTIRAPSISQGDWAALPLSITLLFLVANKSSQTQFLQVVPNVSANNHRFPGSLPQGLERSKIKHLQKGDYWVSEKSDGLRYLSPFPPSLSRYLFASHSSPPRSDLIINCIWRYLLFIVDRGAYLVDRRMDFYQIHKFPYVTAPTLLHSLSRALLPSINLFLWTIDSLIRLHRLLIDLFGASGVTLLDGEMVRNLRTGNFFPGHYSHLSLSRSLSRPHSLPFII